MKRLQYHPEAKVESRKAIDWYWSRSRAAASEFADELKAALVRLRSSPQAYPLYLHGTRRVLLNHYPYFVVYRELPHKIEIIAIAHAKRRPGYWKKRLKH